LIANKVFEVVRYLLDTPLNTSETQIHSDAVDLPLRSIVAVVSLPVVEPLHDRVLEGLDHSRLVLNHVEVVSVD
jgi:hypothetical protein